MKNFFSKFKKKSEPKEESSFTYGILDTFKLNNSDDLIVIGEVKGTISKDMAVYISNIGKDEGGVILTTIIGLEVNKKLVPSATDCLVGVRLKSGSTLDIKAGDILHSREASVSEVHDAYVSTIAQVYVKEKNLELTPEELKSMSITDCAESWRIFNSMISSNKDKMTSEDMKVSRNKVDLLAKELSAKILAAPEIYVVFNKRTGEPHLFSHTIKQNDGNYECTPPDIMVISKAYATYYEKMYPSHLFEIRKIENGEKHDGIYNFLGSNFYLNGACGIRILFDNIAINANVLVKEPNYEGIPEINIPITNPDLMRWILLMGQMEGLDNPETQLIYNLYFNFLSRELPKAKLLVPTKGMESISSTDENGKVTLKENTEISLPTMKGKGDTKALLMYTDWKRLYMKYDASWSGMVQNISGIINSFDCAINVTEYNGIGCYISKEMFEKMETVDF